MKKVKLENEMEQAIIETPIGSVVVAFCNSKFFITPPLGSTLEESDHTYRIVPDLTPS